MAWRAQASCSQNCAGHRAGFDRPCCRHGAL